MNKNHNTSRRDFLKLASTLPIGLAASRLLKTIKMAHAQQEGKQNVLIIVFDAWSARHMSIYGYQRETTPNITRLAEQAIVYHNHHAGGNFTTPGTASLLTGTLPWTHRALQSDGTVIEPFVKQNIFSTFKDHYRIAYTHNPWANTLLEQFVDDLDELVPPLSLFVKSPVYEVIDKTFSNDRDIASVSWTRFVDINAQGYSYSLLFSHLYQVLSEKNLTDIKGQFPRGIPSFFGTSENKFILEKAVDWVGDRLPVLPQPFLGYFHFLPPHGPYRTNLEFYNYFAQDGFLPVQKPYDIFSSKLPEVDLLRKRTAYDEFLLYVDREFERLFTQLKQSGLLENTWVILTSDHGEMFERGMEGHHVDVLYEPVIHVPLMIFEPGRTTGIHIHTPTSAIDLLPTLLHLTGQKIPDWVEGKILEPFSSADTDVERPIFSVRAKKTEHYEPIINRTSLTIMRGQYKLHYYQGFKDLGIGELVKLFDVNADPDELVDLAESHVAIKDKLLGELKAKLNEVNKPYLKE